MRTIPMRAALAAALIVSGISLVGCRDGRPGYNSDYHHHRHHRDRDHRGDHDGRDHHDDGRWDR
ncbi:MAG TPA: hypothetical protein VNZ43_00760 [Sphingomonadaceae bacterium]|nr:hypothetical protein [Sphingomonadaceae bacterium]